MNINKNFKKIAQFWIIPFGTGAFIAIGYITSKKIFVPFLEGSQTQSRTSVSSNEINQHGAIDKNLNRMPQRTTKQSETTLKIEGLRQPLQPAQASKTLGKSKPTQLNNGSKKEGFFKALSSENINDLELIENPQQDKPNPLIENKFKIVDEVLERKNQPFKKLFESLPDP
ncbi:MULTISPECIES: hypothetical protein [Prochlorococcus]|uniref:hypothetical protein n=1 Tax=Prochlorococcus TaxID=1218 RepID=UPI000533AF7C|nr:MULTISPECIES: hypothetical protein [Prochlorococcus]KGG13159.1 hypothetical protein EV05_0837 [Prochlorococcus sp. MIT 0601]